MAKLGKYVSLGIAIILLAATLLIVKPVNSQSVPSPLAPKLTLKLVDYVEGGGLEIDVQNQPVVANGHASAGIYFDFRFKWHESTEWYHRELDPAAWQRQYSGESGTTGVTQMAGSPNNYYEILGNSSSHQLDIQVRAINGYLNETVPAWHYIDFDPNDTPVVVVNTSEWSDTATITLPDYATLNSTQTPTTSATLPPSIQPTILSTLSNPSLPSIDFTTVEVMLGIIAATLIVIALLLFLLLRKKPHNQQHN
jgi:hypothetical protein